MKNILGKYTSETLNQRLAYISDEPKKFGYESFGEKAIPYIGWAWRNVDFDRTDGYEFGVLPVTKGFDSNNKTRVGFMENNKWDYSYVIADKAKWAEIKKLLVVVADNPCRETLKAVDCVIQGLLVSCRQVSEEEVDR